VRYLDAMRTGMALAVMISFALGLGLAGCGHRDPAPAATAGPPTFEGGLDPALGDALAAVDTRATFDWTQRAERALPGPPPEPPPPATRRAIDALIAWAGAGARVHAGCAMGPRIAMIVPLGHVAEAALVLATQPDDDGLRAVVRAGQALRADGNDPFFIMRGLELTEDAARWYQRHGLAGPDALTAEPDLIARAIRAEARCVGQVADANAAAGRISTDDAAAVRAFCAETERQLLAAAPDEVDAVARRRGEEAHQAATLAVRAGGCRGIVAVDVAGKLRRRPRAVALIVYDARARWTRACATASWSASSRSRS
jgi:hypothetical protein